MRSRATTAGFTLMETLMYASLLALVLLMLVNVVFSFTKSYEQIGALRAAEHTGITAMERMIRDIHGASGIVTGLSTLGTSPGVLVVTNGTSTTKFYLSDGEMRIDVDGVYLGPLSISSAKVTVLFFRRIATPKSEAVKIEMTVEGKRGSASKVKTYRSTAILKKS